MVKAQRTKFFLLWFFIVSTCIYLGILLSRPLGDFLYSHNGKSYSASNDGFSEGILSLLLLVGLFMGFGQWLVINTKVKKAYGWILATLIGFGVGSFVSFLIFAVIFSKIPYKYHIVYDWLWMIGTGAGAGICTGACQWVSLKRKIADSIKWSLVMALSFAIGMVLFFLPGSLSSEISTIIVSIAVGLISGIFAESLIIQTHQ
jgi:hypothetical protein